MYLITEQLWSCVIYLRFAMQKFQSLLPQQERTTVH